MMSSHDDSFVASGSSPTRGKAPTLPDFVLENHRTIFLLRPQNEQAIAWIDEHIGSENDFQPYWPTVVIERCYVLPILEGVLAEGMVIA
jgi:hypothetical protein